MLRELTTASLSWIEYGGVSTTILIDVAIFRPVLA